MNRLKHKEKKQQSRV